MNKGFEPDPNTKSWITLSHDEHERLHKCNKVRGIFCLNSKCKHYFEDSCVKILQDDSIEVSEEGKCVSFEAGVCEGYKDSTDPEENAWDKIQSYIVSHNYTWTYNQLEHDYQKYYMKGHYCSHTFLDVVRNNEAECKLLFGGMDHEEEQN